MDVGDLKNVNEKILRRKTEVSDTLTKKYRDNTMNDSVDISVVEQDVEDNDVDRHFSHTLTHTLTEKTPERSKFSFSMPKFLTKSVTDKPTVLNELTPNAYQDLSFKSKKDFVDLEACHICQKEFSSIKGPKRHCKVCGISVCKICSEKKIEKKRLCDICFLKLKNIEGEARKRQFLELSENRIQELKTNLEKTRLKIKGLSKAIEDINHRTVEEISKQSDLVFNLQQELKKTKEAHFLKKEEFKKLDTKVFNTKQDEKALEKRIAEIQTNQNNIKMRLDDKKKRYQARNEAFYKLVEYRKSLENSESFVQAQNQSEQSLLDEKPKKDYGYEASVPQQYSLPDTTESVDRSLSMRQHNIFEEKTTPTIDNSKNNLIVKDEKFVNDQKSCGKDGCKIF